MPRSKNPDKYPVVFKELLLAAYAAKEVGVTWKCPDIKAGRRTRFQLYAYINALERQEDSMATPDEFRESKRLHQIQITVGTALDGVFIKLLNRNFTPENLAIQAALSGLGPLSPDTDADVEARAEAQAIIDAAIAEDREPVAEDNTAGPGTSETPIHPEGDLSSLFKDA